jgi:hypothetical protein
MTTCFPDGTIVRTLANGEKHQSNPDGVEIHTFPDGRQIQIDNHSGIEITCFPDGSREQKDKNTGKILRCTPDGLVQALS